MSKTIGFNADERLKILADALAKRLGYGNVSEMMREWLASEISQNFTPQEQEQIVGLFVKRSGDFASPPTRRGRQPTHQVATKD